MKTPDQRRQDLQDQVNSKIHWDSPESEVLEWLADKHQIEGDDATRMIAIAMKKRVAAIRERALYAAVFAAIGMGISGVFLWIDLLNDDYGRVSTRFARPLFIACAGWFLLSLWRIISGKTDSTIDH